MQPQRKTLPEEIPQAFFRFADAARYIGVTRTKLYTISESDPEFPRKIRISSRCVGFRKLDLDKWLEVKATAARGSAA